MRNGTNIARALYDLLEALKENGIAAPRYIMLASLEDGLRLAEVIKADADLAFKGTGSGVKIAGVAFRVKR